MSDATRPPPELINEACKRGFHAYNDAARFAHAHAQAMVARERERIEAPVLAFYEWYAAWEPTVTGEARIELSEVMSGFRDLRSGK